MLRPRSCTNILRTSRTIPVRKGSVKSLAQNKPQPTNKSLKQNKKSMAKKTTQTLQNSKRSALNEDNAALQSSIKTLRLQSQNNRNKIKELIKNVTLSQQTMKEEKVKSCSCRQHAEVMERELAEMKKRRAELQAERDGARRWQLEKEGQYFHIMELLNDFRRR